jgi:thioredoxin 1
MMAPILERLQKEYRDSLEVVVIDVWKDPDATQSYRIRTIPTQIFFDASGRELYRHEGFLSREEILKKWRELGVDIDHSPKREAEQVQQHAPSNKGPEEGKPAKPDKGQEDAGKTVESAYPGLASGVLTHAKLDNLPEGALLRAGEITISAKELDSKIDEAPVSLREQLKKNKFFLLEQIATEKLLLHTAKKDAAEKKKDLSGKTDREVIQQYLESLVSTIQVTDKEIVDFYEENKAMVGGIALEQVKDQIKDYLLGQKRQQAVYKHILTLGERVSISVSASWVKEQAVLAKDNPVDKARATGKPTLVEFGASGCGPCDMMQPILDALRKKYGEKLNIIFVHVGEEQILGARYGIQAIPVQVFFDKDGKEFFRHVGFFPQEEVEKKLAQMGVK